MAPVFTTAALLRPCFTADDFTPTKWDTSEVKAGFANDLCRFMSEDFKERLFTEKLYKRLSLCWGHIAHYDRAGFFAEFFHDLKGKITFLHQTMQWTAYGDPAFTYSDVERGINARLWACDLRGAYVAHHEAEVESAERELLRRLQQKYDSGGAPRIVTSPVIHRPAPPSRTNRPAAASDQANLF